MQNPTDTTWQDALEAHDAYLATPAARRFEADPRTVYFARTAPFSADHITFANEADALAVITGLEAARE